MEGLKSAFMEGIGMMKEGDEYCVNTSTIITIDAYDDGCCDNLTVLYTHNFSQDLEDWIDISDQLPFNLTFNLCHFPFQRCQEALRNGWTRLLQ